MTRQIVGSAIAVGCLACLLAAAAPAQTTRPTTRNAAPTFDETRLTGAVTDEATGEPVASFNVIPGYGSLREYILHHWKAQPCTDGVLDVLIDRRFEKETGYHAILVRIEADGYAPHVAELATDVQELRLDLKLRPTKDIVGTVVRPDGKPAAGAIVFRGTKTSAVVLEEDRPPLPDDHRAPLSKADEDGRFACRPTDGVFRLVAIHDTGYADVMSDDFSADKPIALKPWGRIEGIVMRGAEPLADSEIVLEAEATVNREGRPSVWRTSKATSDADGRFVFPRVAPGPAQLFRRVEITDGISNGKTCVTAVTVEPDQTAHVQIGGRGRPVTGQVAIPDGMNERCHASMGAMLNLVTASNSLGEYAYITEVDESGAFSFTDVEPGTYRLHIQFHARDVEPSLRGPGPEAIAQREVIVPDIPGGRSDEPLDIGEVEPKPHKFP
jgi:hypothetical protein